MTSSMQVSLLNLVDFEPQNKHPHFQCGAPLGTLARARAAMGAQAQDPMGRALGDPTGSYGSYEI